MKIIFMGTPEFATNSLQALIDNNFEILAVVTQPDKFQGRKQEVIYSPVKKLALENGLKVLQPNNIREEYKEIIALNADLIVTAAYGQILPQELLDAIPAINVHGSLLPKYRGGAPIQYALFDGLKKTGVTIMDMAFKMDSGDIILQDEVLIEDSDNYETLSNKLAILGANLLIDVLNNNYPRRKQIESEVTYAYTLKRVDEFLDFYLDADMVINRLRGLMPNIGGSFIIGDNIIKVFNLKKSDIIKDGQVGEVFLTNKKFLVKTKTAWLEILEIQVPGKKRMKVAAFLNGQKIIKSGDLIERKKDEY